MDDTSKVKDVIDAVLAKIETHPALSAVEHDGKSISYESLAELSFGIAGLIQSRAPTNSPRVLLALPPSPHAYAGMVGTLLAGGTFSPLNLNGPPGRNAEICKIFSPDIILYDKVPPDFLDSLPLTTHCVDVRQSGNDLLCNPADEQSEIAYVVFTSGSTGNPKGVKVGRSAFSHFLHIVPKYFNLGVGERWGQFSNLGHDMGVMDVFMALAQSATLVPLDEAQRLRPATAIRTKSLSVWQSVPSVIELILRARQLTPDNLSSLRVMSFCGEPLHPHHLEALFAARPDLQVFNTYGTTETVGFNTFNHLTAQNYSDSCEAGSVAIGEDVMGWQIQLCGGENADEGEVVVVSDHLSLGYWQDENRTRAVFRQLRFANGERKRAYFTGDRGIRKGSRIYCSGRLDRQIKIRGERIELDEIDGILRESGFIASYTILKDGELYSFVETSEEIDQERVRGHLSKSLPFHSIPKCVRPLSSLPRNANGKIDRAALAEMAGAN